MPEPSITVATARALGTGVQLAVTEGRVLEQAMAIVLEWLDELDRAASRFRPDSELSRLQQRPGEPVTVSPLLARVLAVALDVAAMTDGIVDPTVGSSMEAIGYDRDFAQVQTATPAEPGGAVPAPGWASVRLDRAGATVALPRGVHIDVGSSAKAFAADETAALASAATGAGVLVNLGGDIAVSGPPPPGGWLVRVTDDHAASPEAPGQTVAIHEGGLATSSTTVRAWTAGATPMHHIVDPRTGRPAAVVWRTVSVTAMTCVLANAASTAAIVLGHAAEAWLAARAFPARLVGGDGAVCHVCGWPEAGEDAVAGVPSVLTD